MKAERGVRGRSCLTSWYTDMPFSITGRMDSTNEGIREWTCGVCENIAREGCPGQHTGQGE